MCTQVVPAIGPYTGGYTARISKIDASGNRTTVVDTLPSSQTSSAQGSLASGVVAMTFGPDGSTPYVTNLGFGFPAGMGLIVTVKITD